MKTEIKIFIDYLRQKNLKNTSQREEILGTFLNTERHLTIEDLYALVRKKDPDIGYATVYRTLKLICKCGLAQEIDFGDGKVRFEHKYGHEHHDHLVCLDCGKFIEVVNPDIEKLQDKLAKQYNFTPLRHRLEIFGLCQECERK